MMAAAFATRPRIVAVDPDLAQAVKDKLDDLAEIRDLIAADIRLPRSRHATRIGELFADFGLRADRLQIDLHTLIAATAAELDRRKGRFAFAGEVRARLKLVESQAIGREQEAHAALTRAQDEVRAATLARHHAQARCLALGIPVQS